MKMSYSKKISETVIMLYQKQRAGSDAAGKRATAYFSEYDTESDQ
mgnify:CR=1 FL=1